MKKHLAVLAFAFFVSGLAIGMTNNQARTGKENKKKYRVAEIKTENKRKREEYSAWAKNNPSPTPTQIARKKTITPTPTATPTPFLKSRIKLK